MIESAQFVNGIWMGTILLMIALVPATIDDFAGILNQFADAVLLRSPLPVRMRLPLRQAPASAFKYRWHLAVMGISIMGAATLAYLIR
jgi:hypothetical protein